MFGSPFEAEEFGRLGHVFELSHSGGDKLSIRLSARFASETCAIILKNFFAWKVLVAREKAQGSLRARVAPPVAPVASRAPQRSLLEWIPAVAVRVRRYSHST